MLTVQYRMHPDIRSFPSQQFYQGKLADAKFLREGSSASAPSSTTNSSQPPVIMPYHAAPYFKPYLVFDVCHGREQMVGTSIINLIEAQFAVSIFKRLQVSREMTIEIVVVSFYLTSSIITSCYSLTWFAVGVW